MSHASPMKCLCCVALSGSFSFREEPQVTGWPYHVFQDAITMAFMKYPSIKNNGTIHKTQMQHVLISPESRLKSDERDIQHKKFFFFQGMDIMPKTKSPCLGSKKENHKNVVIRWLSAWRSQVRSRTEEARLWREKKSEPKAPHF